MMKRLLLMSLVSALTLTGCEQAAEEPIAIAPKPAKLIVIKEKPSFRTVQLPAVIEAAEEAVLTFQVPGLVEKLVSQEGKEVKKGQILAQVNQRDYRNAVAVAQAEFDQAESEYRRAKSLIKQNAIARSVLELRLAQRNKAKAALDSARKRLEDTVLRAPYDAIIAKVHIEQFENIAPQQPIIALLSASGSAAVVQVPASIMIRSETEVPDKVTLQLDAAPGIIFSTRLLEAAAKADASSQTFEVRYAFKASDDLVVLPGMTGTLTGKFVLPPATLTNTYSVPLSVVVSEAGNTYVWVVDETTMLVSRRNVQVTPSETNEVIITGVKKGEILVAAGGSYLFEGAEVRRYER